MSATLLLISLAVCHLQFEGRCIPVLGFLDPGSASLSCTWQCCKAAFWFREGDASSPPFDDRPVSDIQNTNSAKRSEITYAFGLDAHFSLTSGRKLSLEISLRKVRSWRSVPRLFCRLPTHYCDAQREAELWEVRVARSKPGEFRLTELYVDQSSICDSVTHVGTK